MNPRSARSRRERDVRGRHRVAADGSPEQPDDDLRRAACSSERVGIERLQADGRRALRCGSSASASVRCSRRRRVLGDGPAIRPRRSRRRKWRCPVAPADRELQALVSRLACTPLDPARPLWQFHLVDELSRRQRGHHAHPPLLRRRHRARAVLMSMTDAGPDGPPAMPAAVAPAQGARERDDPLAELSRPSAGVMTIALQGRRDADREGYRRSGTSRRTGARARRAGWRADRGDRQARADARGFADALQGRARRRQARRVGRAHPARRGEGRSARRWARRSTTSSSPASRAPCASTWSTRATRSTA